MEDIIFYSGSLEIMRIYSDGRVGFGTINPSMRLDIYNPNVLRRFKLLRGYEF